MERYIEGHEFKNAQSPRRTADAGVLDRVEQADVPGAVVQEVIGRCLKGAGTWRTLRELRSKTSCLTRPICWTNGSFPNGWSCSRRMRSTRCRAWICRPTQRPTITCSISPMTAFVLANA